jgi:hypothetical protein
LNLFRVPKRGLKNCFAECFTLALGKEAFAECFFWHSAKNKKHLAKKFLCRVFFLALGKETSLPSVFYSLPSAEALPSVFYLALGEALFAERPKKRLAKPPALGKEADSGSACLLGNVDRAFPCLLVIGFESRKCPVCFVASLLAN